MYLPNEDIDNVECNEYWVYASFFSDPYLQQFDQRQDVGYNYKKKSTLTDEAGKKRKTEILWIV